LRTLKEQAEKGLEGVTIQSADDYDSGRELGVFFTGYHVNVKARSWNEFSNFSGVVVSRDWERNTLEVRDEETGNIWECFPSQCQLSSDAVMHGE
jgi:hypothetical protein